MSIVIKRTRVSSGLSLTPLIDVIFLLLIFFIVATNFSPQEAEVDIELPSASQARPLLSQPAELVINVDKQGAYFINGKFRQPEEVERILRTAQASNPTNQTVVIRADRSSNWGAVMTAFDLCKKVGIHEYSIGTDDE